MGWILTVVAVLILGVAAIAATGRLGGMHQHVETDTFRQTLPAVPLTAEDVAKVRFGVTLRGYAVDQVDDLLDRLAREIHVRDLELATLREKRALAPNGSPVGTGPDDAE
ncbi:DivIVA domain-containing protein [Enemella sp. A6]|uniref:DivIVA domain-containing protein n=1 Tax=Enemella sp. A6 TaxID=3440152 RepID=UPI003EBF5903